MERDKFIKYLLDKKEFIRELDIKERELKIKGSKHYVTTVIGPRRAGKTYLFYSMMKKLSNFIYVNFEDTLFSSFEGRELFKLIDYYSEFFGKEPTHLFFDEIQNVKNWERVIRELYEMKKYEIYVTGSSSKLLSKEIATSLRGRTISYMIFPLSFKEVIRLNEIEIRDIYSSSEERKIKRILKEYMIYGGFPDVVINKVPFDRFLRSYVEAVLYRDIVERYNIRKLHFLKTLMNYASSSYSSKFSISKTYKTFKSLGMKVSKDLVYEYFNYLVDSFFIFPLYKYSLSPREASFYLPKVYFVDSSLAKYFEVWEESKVLENVVYLHLLRKGKVWYWQDSFGKEVDFVFKHKEKKYLINVTLELNKRNYEREIKNLIIASKKLGIKNLILVTFDEESKIKEGSKKIEVIPAFKFLLKF